MNVYLIGFMGSGKTTIGKHLAEKLGLQFTDLDVVIETIHGQTIGNIFSSKGEQAFRELEREALSTILGNKNQVVSVGGGAPCFFDNIEKMKDSGLTVYLKMSATSLTERLWGLPESARQARPLLANKTKAELEKFIETSLAKREPFYNRAKVVVANDESDPRLSEQRIMAVLQYYKE